MAISKVLHMKQAKSGYPAKHLANGLKYIMDPQKTGGGRYVCGNGCIPENALSQMLETKRHFGKRDKRQAYHFIISFEKGEVMEETAFQIMVQFAEEYLGTDYEAVYAVHNDTDHIHGHIIFNSVRCTDGRKYDYPKGEWEHRIQPLVNRLCKEHGLSVLDMEEVKRKRRSTRNGDAGKKVSERADREFRQESRQDCILEEERKTELLFVFIPCHNRHLTRHQKEIFMRKYRAGKHYSNPKTQAYKANCQALKRLQEEYLFWSEHGIQTREDIRWIACQAEERLVEIRARKKKLAGEKQQHREIFYLLKELESCEMEAALYQEGYPEYAKEYRQYQNICRQLEESGVPLADARKLERDFQTESDRLEAVRIEIWKEKRTARRLEEKIYGREGKQKAADCQEQSHEGWDGRVR